MTPEQDMATEEALFDNAVDGGDAPVSQPEASPPATAPEQAPEPATAEPAAKPETAPERPPVDDDAPLIPSWRLREITEERRAAQAERDTFKRERDQLAAERQEYQRRLAALEKPATAASPDAPDPLLYPKEFIDFMKRDVEERLLNERREFSLQLAKRTYRDEFDQAYEVARHANDPALMARMQRTADPGETLMAWFRSVKRDHEVGPDLEAYKQKVRDEAKKDPEFRKAFLEEMRNEAPAQTNGRPNIQLGPSLNGISRSNAALRASQSDLSDDDLWDSTTT